MFRRYVWTGLTLALGIFFLVFFFHQVEAEALWDSLVQANYLLALPAIAAYFVGVWFRVLRWRLLLVPLVKVGPQRLFPPLCISFALNNILPGRVGLVARAYLVGQKEGISKLASGTTVVLDQVFDGVALTFMVLVISLAVPLTGWARSITSLAIFLWGGFSLLFFLAVFASDIPRRLARLFLRRHWRERAEEWLNLSLTGAAALRNPVSLALILFFSVLVWLSEAAAFYFVALAFHLQLPYYVLILAVAIANLALALPSLPGGVGPYEFFGRQILTSFGVNEAMATSYVGVLHLVILVPITVLGLGLLWWHRWSITRVSRGGP